MSKNKYVLFLCFPNDGFESEQAVYGWLSAYERPVKTKITCLDSHRGMETEHIEYTFFQNRKV